MGSLVWPSITVPDMESDWPRAVDVKKTKTKNNMLCVKILKRMILNPGKAI